ncbi:hypothetical protein D3C76_932360 [compost metagenome]
MAECRILRAYVERRRVNGISAANLDRTFGIGLQAAEHINMAHCQINRVRTESSRQLPHEQPHLGAVG